MWFKIVTLCVVVALFKKIEAFPSVGIINGKDAGEKDFPHHVLVTSYFTIVKENDHTTYCGGSLISPTKVLTAAQCLQFEPQADKTLKANKVDITIGCLTLPCEDEKYHITVNDSDKIKVHPDFNLTAGKADLAFITLPTKIKESETLKVIEMDFSNDEHKDDKAKISGWGQTKDDGVDGVNDAPTGTLKYAEVKVLSNEDCNKTLTGIQNYHMCTAAENDGNIHTGICFGDTGGALVSSKGKQIGIASFIIGKCEDKVPNIYTRISKYEDWIKENSSYQIVASKILLSLLSFVILLRNSF